MAGAKPALGLRPVETTGAPRSKSAPSGPASGNSASRQNHRSTSVNRPGNSAANRTCPQRRRRIAISAVTYTPAPPPAAPGGPPAKRTVKIAPAARASGRQAPRAATPGLIIVSHGTRKLIGRRGHRRWSAGRVFLFDHTQHEDAPRTRLQDYGLSEEGHATLVRGDPRTGKRGGREARRRSSRA